MWSYYGAKTNIVHLYPKPKLNRIIEPFAGTARYSLLYFENDIILMDKYDVIVRIWKYLQQCSPKDILGLPRFKPGDNINSVTYDCEEQRLLVGFLVGFGFWGPRQTATPRLRNRPNAMNYTIKQIAAQLFKIKHWTILHGSYEQIENQPATWFIDPPYFKGGEHYVKGSKNIDYSQLAEYCTSRIGQVIVCENSHANWLPFIPLTTQNVLSGPHRECIYTNWPTSLNTQQLSIF